MLPVLLGDVAEGVALGAGDAGRVDEDVDVPVDGAADFVGAGLAREVGHDGAEAVAHAAEHLDGGGELVAVEVGHDDTHAVVEEEAGRLEPDAAGRAGNDRGAAFDLEVHKSDEKRGAEKKSGRRRGMPRAAAVHLLYGRSEPRVRPTQTNQPMRSASSRTVVRAA